ncbi:hypothetical protein MUGA111182_07040 [Mucilaginibacter galii]|uniref:Uncharacterized protein n=1 Tax=Mucilaginibacter galii TaxID=2005073 RepID=A0A917N413_9SPHI|nr:hypothetical protein [Mucilaginibacter galii]GGI51592.1 hypothetical protein GCM10011425_28040 [Mucilaginibacter galii]
MSIFNSPRLRERKQGLASFAELAKDKSRCFIIHYSCESFVTLHGRTPRVTSICIKSLGTAQTISFSIHLQAQFARQGFDSLSDGDYDTLEVAMLSEFSTFVKRHSGYRWIHWNMRDSNYGFEAINNRLRILNGDTFDIDDDRKYDFPRMLGLIYTYGYEANRPKGRLLNLAERNNISTINALTGSEEATAFDNRQYLQLHMSTLKKVDVIESIFQRTEVGELKVNVDWKTIYGTSLVGIINVVNETPWLLAIVSVISLIAGAALEPIIQRLFHTA